MTSDLLNLQSVQRHAVLRCRGADCVPRRRGQGRTGGGDFGSGSGSAALLFLSAQRGSAQRATEQEEEGERERAPRGSQTPMRKDIAYHHSRVFVMCMKDANHLKPPAP